MKNVYRAAAVVHGEDEALARRMVEPDLSREDALLWAGRPATGLLLRPVDAFAIPFSLFWGGLASAWEITMILRGPFQFAVFGLPFVGVGLYIMVGRFVVDAHRRARTFYGLTNTRMVIVHHGRTRHVVAIDLAACPQIALTERADGSGTLTFDEPSWQHEHARQWQPTAGAPILEGVRNAHEVFAMIRDRQDELHARESPSSGARESREGDVDA